LSIQKTVNPTGILGVSNPVGGYPGISIFNGQLSQMVGREQLSGIFEDDMNLDYIQNCRAAWDGRFYHLLYPSGSETQPDKWAAIDFSKFSQNSDIRIAKWEDLSAQSIDVDKQTKKVYIGGSDGVARQNSGTESVDVEIETCDFVGPPDAGVALANTTKTLETIKYNIDTGGETVQLRVIIDGEVKSWDDDSEYKEISGTGDKVQVIRSLPNTFEGYVFSLRVTGTGLTTFKVYTPWELEYNATP
jgi:hypothetical protein